MTRVVTRLLKAGSLRPGDQVSPEGLVKSVRHVSSAMVIVVFEGQGSVAFDSSYFVRVIRTYPTYVKET
jgi:hypothetical protein